MVQRSKEAPPHSEGKASVWAEHTKRLCHCLAGPGKVQHAERTRHCIKACVGVLKMLRISNLVLCCGESAPSLFDHLACDIGAGCVGALPCGFGRHITGSG